MGRKKIKPIIDLDIMGNPFAKDIKIEVVSSCIDGIYRKDGDILVPNVYLREREVATKIYRSPDSRGLICGLSEVGLRIFVWLTYEVETGKDYVWVNRVRIMKELGIKSVNTYKLGIENLIRYDVIALSLIKDVYWINPRLFFSGNRVKKYRGKVNIIK